jgi:hypothetical protein
MTSTIYPLALALASLGPAAPGDEALPGRDGKYDFVGQVEGTRWDSDVEEPGPVRVLFRRDGECITLVTSVKNYMLIGKWKQSGDMICFPTRSRDIVFVGVVHGDRIIGNEIIPEGDHRRMIWTRSGPNRDAAQK